MVVRGGENEEAATGTAEDMGAGQSQPSQELSSVKNTHEAVNNANGVPKRSSEEAKNSKEVGNKSNEVPKRSSEEAKKSKEAVNNANEILSRASEEGEKSKEVVNSANEVPRRSSEKEKKSREDDIVRPIEAKGKLAEVTKRSKEELQKVKEVVTNKTIEAAKKVPHKYEVIMKEVADKIQGGGREGHIHSGTFLDDKKKKYWVEERGHNCFMVFARGLSITWSDDHRFWQWSSMKETSDTDIEVANLLNVCWLEINGRYETTYLTPGVMYEVLFVVLLKEFGYGWEVPVNLRLTLPDGSKQQNKQCLQEKPKGQWIELKVGEFMASSNQAGEMEFSLFEYEGGQWKRGLLVKGVTIRPKKRGLS